MHNLQILTLATSVAVAALNSRVVKNDEDGSPVTLEYLMKKAYTAVEKAHEPIVEEVPVPALTPAVAVNKSVHHDYIVCLDDGLKFKSLKRHLRQLGMTPDEYRAKWNLRSDYPMVAPGYSATRSKLAKDNGLGRKAA